LRSVQLENLAEAFEKENITPDILKDLTDADLRELGVASMADRKRLMRLGSELGRQEAPQISGATPGAASGPAPSAAPAGQNWPTSQGASPSVSGAAPNADTRAERVFYEGVVDGAATGKSDDGGDDDASGSVSIRVTSHRAIIGPKTFLLHNIAAVQVGTKKGESPTSIKISAVVGAGVCFAIAIGMACSGGDNGGAVGCCAVLGLACLAGLFAKRDPTIYSVRIDASGTSSDAIAGTNKAKMQEIVDAINQAIVNLNVAKQ